jgi:hypothetical protein
MTDITVTAAKVGASDTQQREILHLIAGATITAGQAVYQTTAGKADLADASATGTAQVVGIALTGGVAGQPIAILKRGFVEGFSITGLTYGVRVYLSDTAGALADSAGTVAVTLGRVVANTDGALTKLLYIDTNWLNQYT